MNRDEMDAAIQAFLNGGGQVTRLQYAGKKAVEKSRRMAYHRERALCGSERSQRVIAAEEAKEKNMIFSRIERNKEG